MKTRTKRIAGLAAVGVLAGGGIAGAFAATSGQGNDPADDLANALSKQTGAQISSTQVKAAFKDVLTARFDKDVAAGRLIQAQADQMLARVGDGHMMGMGGPHGEHGPGRGMHQVGAAVAKALGVDEAALRQARDQGTTLTRFAQQKGVSRADLVAAVVTALKATPRGASLSDSRATQMAGRIADATPGAMREQSPRTQVHRALLSTLGVSDADLRAARGAGKSPDDLGKEKGVSRDDLVAAVTAALKKAGPPNGAQVASAARLAQMADDIVDGTGPGGHGRGGPDGRGPSGP